MTLIDAEDDDPFELLEEGAEATISAGVIGSDGP